MLKFLPLSLILSLSFTLSAEDVEKKVNVIDSTKIESGKDSDKDHSDKDKDNEKDKDHKHHKHNDDLDDDKDHNDKDHNHKHNDHKTTDSNADIIGKWKMSKTIRWEFMSDGTGLYDSNVKVEWKVEKPGVYKVSGSNINRTITVKSSKFALEIINDDSNVKKVQLWRVQ